MRAATRERMIEYHGLHGEEPVYARRIVELLIVRDSLG
jgi:hypothetical protein